MNPNTTKFIAEVQQELTVRMGKALDRYTQFQSEQTIKELLDDFDMMIGLVEAYKMVEPESANKLADLQQEIILAQLHIQEKHKEHSDTK